MAGLVSIIIPNYNGGATIGKCLEAAFASVYDEVEIVVVDDCSTDDSVDVIRRFPCKLIRLNEHAGAARARNVGAANSSGDILFFTDADCLLEKNAVSIAGRFLASNGTDVVVGGTYTPLPYDNSFFSLFQSIFINYSETKNAGNPDYIATHAMVIGADTFWRNHGFSESFLPILEDVEFSHRLSRAGIRLVVNPEIQVRHIFGFSLLKSLRNAVVKSMYWTIYSLRNKDLLADSGTASVELKSNVVAYWLCVLLLLGFSLTTGTAILLFLPLVLSVNLLVNERLLRALYRTGGLSFSIVAALYYLIIYPLPVSAGALAGIVRYRRTVPGLESSG